MNNQLKSVKYSLPECQPPFFEDIMRYGSCAILVITLVSTALCAEELMLKNGDLIKGSLIDQTADQIVWASENFGPLTIASDRV